MGLALYHPEHGYYSHGGGGGFLEIGRRGDFYTSVSVGETFGLLLAHRIVRDWGTTFARARPFVVVEQGGHDGQLARDLLAGLRELGSPLLADFEYRLVEPREALRERLAARFAENPDPRIRVIASIEEARAASGIFLCNELLDAFPVDLLSFEDGHWHERQVGWDPTAKSPRFVTRPLRPEWAAFTESLGGGFPEGYVTELCPSVDDWMVETAELFERGLWWIIDYGHERADYYLPQRRTGTLRCYREHHATEDPFAHPGGQDLTAHVDFTRVEEAAVRGGLSRNRFTDQHHFLVDSARSWLLSLEGRSPDARTAKRLRQFQTLTHPSMMGQQFKVMELARLPS
jgi:SAM-dependent MidA family methyltransferase